jgi:cytochrome c peroxidase
MDKGCSACHNGINVGGKAYFPFGVVEKPGADILPPNDKGRFAVTKTASDEYVFRAGPLRNVALRAPYFHSGQVWSLKEAVAVMGSSQLGQKLTDQEENAIVEFLQTLTGEQPKIELPILPLFGGLVCFFSNTYGVVCPFEKAVRKRKLC